MRNSNIKIFTMFIYLLLVILIIGSVSFLVVQRVQVAKQAQAYAEQIVDRINNSYVANGSFTVNTFTRDIKDAMQSFSDLIKVITIVDSEDIMQNRFRLDSIDPEQDNNPNWQNELEYSYNPFLYEEKSYPLYLPGQVNANINILYQRLPIQLIKDVLQFDTIVILALLILSFLTFLFIPKRDPAETAWALKSVNEEDELYHEIDNIIEENDIQQIIGEKTDKEQKQLGEQDELPESWHSHDLPENSWGEESEEKNAKTVEPEEDEFAHLLGSNQLNSDIVHIESNDDRWGDQDSEKTSKDIDTFLENEKVDLSFNDDSIAEQEIQQSSIQDIDDYIASQPALPDEFVEKEAEEFDIPSAENTEAITTEEEHELGDLLDNEFPDLETSSFLGLNDEFVNVDRMEATENEQEFEELDFGDELVDDLDEGLGDDALEAIEDQLDANIFSQLMAAESVAATELAEENADDMEIIEDTASPEQTDEPLNDEDTPQPMTEERRQEVLSWLENFLEDQKANFAENDTPELSVALLETDKTDVEIVRASLEQDLALKASILPNDNGMSIVLPCKNIQYGIEELQNAAGRLPFSYLKNLKMGITGVSAVRSNVEPAIVLAEMEYALANSDQDNNISIFDANDQVFNQQFENV